MYPKVKGIFMRNWNQLDSEKCLEEDMKDFEKVVDQLKIEDYEIVDFEKEYWLDVFEPMISDYKRGVTPNPDINCNRYVKFGKLVEYLTEKYGDGDDWWLVTGHYSRILKDEETGEMKLLKAYHIEKDQSYYLSQIDPKVLKRLLLPIGHYLKPEVRDIAKSLDLVVASKPDSTGLCFVNPTQGSFNDFLRNFIDETPGEVITEDGKVWGKHDGLWTYTIGQKSRISMPQGDPAYKGVWFVSEKNFQTNEITIVRGVNNERLFKKLVYVDGFKLLADVSIDLLPIEELTVQYRSLQKPIALSEIVSNGEKCIVRLKDKQRAIAVGQYLAVYHGERCLGSGVISGAE
jgi:tRNA-specific 2-thiouridylase